VKNVTNNMPLNVYSMHLTSLSTEKSENTTSNHFSHHSFWSSLITKVFFSKHEIISLNVSKTKTYVFVANVSRCSRWNL